MMETELPGMEAAYRQTPLSSKASAFSIEALMGQKVCRMEREHRNTDENETGSNQMDDDEKYLSAADASYLMTTSLFDVHG